jgi:hypothetical protein
MIILYAWNIVNNFLNLHWFAKRFAHKYSNTN